MSSSSEGAPSRGLPFSAIYGMQAKTVDGLFQAARSDMLPDQSTELIFGMGSIGEPGHLLYCAFRALQRHGRISRSMLEQTMCYTPTSYREYMTLWIQSLPPQQRDHYTATLCKTKFQKLPWDTDPKFLNYFTQVGALGDERLDSEDNLIRRSKPPEPVGDNRHDPRCAKVARVAQEFFNLFAYGLIFDGPESIPDLVLHEGHVRAFLLEHGALFGIDAPELPWDEGRSFGLRIAPDARDVWTVSELMLRTWNALYYCGRLSVTELESALMHPGTMREFMARAVYAALSLAYQGRPFAEHGRTIFRSVIDLLRGNNRIITSVETAPDDFQLVFADLIITTDEKDSSFLECDYCGSKLEKQKACSRCKTAMYCNGDCQKKDWARHKPLCSRYVAAREQASAGGST